MELSPPQPHHNASIDHGVVEEVMALRRPVSGALIGFLAEDYDRLLCSGIERYDRRRRGTGSTTGIGGNGGPAIEANANGLILVITPPPEGRGLRRGQDDQGSGYTCRQIHGAETNRDASQVNHQISLTSYTMVYASGAGGGFGGALPERA